MARLLVGLLLIALPVVEMTLLIKIGQSIGAWRTVGLVIVSGIAGSLVLSRQSMSVLTQILNAASQDQPPVKAAMDGALLMLAGLLLLVPGVLTDAMSVPLFIPAVRQAVARWSLRHLMRHADLHVHRSGSTFEWRPHPQPPHGPGNGPPVIEGEFERVDENVKALPGERKHSDRSKPSGDA